jgi:hypothetical protein
MGHNCIQLVQPHHELGLQVRGGLLHVDVLQQAQLGEREGQALDVAVRYKMHLEANFETSFSLNRFKG